MTFIRIGNLNVAALPILRQVRKALDAAEASARTWSWLDTEADSVIESRRYPDGARCDVYTGRRDQSLLDD